MLSDEVHWLDCITFIISLLIIEVVIADFDSSNVYENWDFIDNILQLTSTNLIMSRELKLQH